MKDKNLINYNSAKYLLPDWVQNICLNPQKSQGSYLYDDKSERRILDFYNFFSTLPLGYNHTVFNSEAFRSDLLTFGGLKPSTGRILTSFFDNFVLEFNDFVNGQIFNKYFFIHGGGLAVENALKISFDWKRNINKLSGHHIDSSEMEVLSLVNGFHGITGYGLSLSTNELKCNHYPKFDWPKFEPSCASWIDGTKFKTSNSTSNRLAKIENYIEKRGKEKISSIIIELIQGGGGDQHLCKNFVIGLKNICKKNDILLIIDEVQTGLGTSGKLWCYEHYGVEPDLLTFGKKAQISGVCINRRIPNISEVINVPGRLSPTWNGDISDYVRCKYIMKTYQKDGLIENASTLGQYILSSLKEMNTFLNVRGRGFLIAFDFESTEKRNQYEKLCFDNGLFLLPMREFTLRMRPNMALTKSEADNALEIMDKVNRMI